MCPPVGLLFYWLFVAIFFWISVMAFALSFGSVIFAASNISALYDTIVVPGGMVDGKPVLHGAFVLYVDPVTGGHAYYRGQLWRCNT